jgi:hypothetical protein
MLQVEAKGAAMATATGKKYNGTMRALGTILWAIGGAVLGSALIVIAVYAAGGEFEASDAAFAGIVGVCGATVALIGIVVFRKR